MVSSQILGKTRERFSRPFPKADFSIPQERTCQRQITYKTSPPFFALYTRDTSTTVAMNCSCQKSHVKTRKSRENSKRAGVMRSKAKHLLPSHHTNANCELGWRGAFLYQFDFMLFASCLMMNEEQTFYTNHALLVSSVWSYSLVGCLRCLRRLTFFQQQKKVSKKCRSQTPRGLHSAKRFCNRTTCAGLQSGLHNGCWLRDGLTRCA